MGLQHPDRLEVGRLRGPLLNQFYGSAFLRASVMAIAHEIMRRHLAKLPTDTGNLRSTARVTSHRSTVHPDRRWEAQYTIGGPRADYIRPLEEEHHYLAATLREMGYNTGDVANGPTGTINTEDRAPRRAPQNESGEERQAKSRTFGTNPDSGYEQLRPLVEKVQKPGRRPGSAAMERDVAALRSETARIEAEMGRGEAALGRTALAGYELIKQARQERDQN